MSVDSDPVTKPPTCSTCEIEMEFRGEGTAKTIPIVGQEVEFQQYSCPECGQGARFERRGPDEWTRPTF